MLEKQKISKLEELIGLFEYNITQYKGKNYDEAKTRVDFIDKLFSLLEWDIDNSQGYSEQYRDVVREDRVTIKGKVKAPDYCFRIGGVRKFFVEAKKPAIDIKHDIVPAFQLRRYAYTSKLPLSILTDFEEFAVYDTRIKPDKTDKASQARIFYCTYNDYLDEADFIFNTFSKAAILKGSFDKYVEGTKRKKGTSEVDKEFLKLIENWRENLAKNIALRNKELSIYELNYVVQVIIDRIVFLRIAEDRHMESYGRIKKLLETKAPIYPELVKLFLQADVKYNSGLFDFKKDEVTPHLKIDDKILKDIIKNLYYPDSPYEFSVLDVEILGNIYEQFLGKTIRLTPSHQAKVEDKPEVKKAGGVYYTPKYIVDYIVGHTVGEKIKGKKPEDISGLKILDPACGSGSFLLGAYRLLLDHHLNYYAGGPTHKDESVSKKQRAILEKALKENKIFHLREGEYRLTIEEKHNILLNNIFGVDIDRQAVEVTKLSLLLKLLEGESMESAGLLFKYTDIKLLPDLSGNIKCGNSLIGSDFYEKGQKSLFPDEETVRRINVFDWEEEFPDIFRQGGFDVVIGNPPYVRQEMIKEFKEYFQKYKVFHTSADLYVYFFEKGIDVLKSHGLFGIIVANKWLKANYGNPLRKKLKKWEIKEIIDFGDLPVFQNATTYPCIVIIDKISHKSDIKTIKLKNLSFNSLAQYIAKNNFLVSYDSLDDKGWSLIDKKTKKLLSKIKNDCIFFGEYVKGNIYRGILTGLDKVFVIDEKMRNQLINDEPQCEMFIKKYLVGRDVHRYYLNEENKKYVILIPSGWTRKQSREKNDWNWFRENYPILSNYLRQYEEIAKIRYDKGENWWELRPCIYYREFEKPKIMYLKFQVKPAFTYDTYNYYANSAVWIIPTDDLLLLGILNSKMGWFLISNVCTEIQGGYQLIFDYLKNIPLPRIEINDLTRKNQNVKIVEHVTQMLEFQGKYNAAKIETEKKLFKKQIDIIDNQIDQLVYQLYGLTDEEIKIIEDDTN